MTDNYFSEDELSCPCCGKNEFNPGTLRKFNLLREYVGFPLPMTSGYRCPAYNKKKGYTKTHSTGQAGDIGVSHKKAVIVLEAAIILGLFTGIGINQKGDKRFIHFDDLDEDVGRPRPHIWSY